jgi:aminomethyltransferase
MLMSGSIHADTESTVRVSARRFEQSPYFDMYANDETVLGVVAGRYYTVSIGEDPVEAYWTLRRKAVLYDVPEKPWQIEGPDAVAFLERVFARRICDLPVGRGRYAIACTADGGIFMDGILFNLGENRYWYVQPDGALEPWLTALRSGFDVHVTDPKSRVLQIQGPASRAILSHLTNGATDELTYFRSGHFDIDEQWVYVSRTGWTGELGYEVYSEGATTDHAALWSAIEAAGHPHGMVYASMASMEIRRIEAGILDNLTDFDQTMTPFAAGLGAFIDLDKDDFVGRDALRHADQRPRLFGVRCRAADLEYHGVVVADGVEVGHVTAAARSPHLECSIGYVRFADPSDWIGTSVLVQANNGDLLPCTVEPLPFYDAEKRIPRGLDTSTP